MIVASSVDQPNGLSHPRRWRLRFSLRTLLLLMTAICVWLGFLVSSARRQERAVEAIEAVGGRVGYEHDFDKKAGYWREGEPPGPEWLRSLFGRYFFDTVVSVDFSEREMESAGKRYTDVGPYLADLSHLRRLSLWALDMDDHEFAMVATHANPEELFCGMMEISDQEAARLAGATRLRQLGLNDVIISAKGVAEFKKLTNLEKFWLCCKHMDYGPHGEPIWNVEKYALRDDAIEAFPEFPRLRRLSLSFTLITDDGVAILSRMSQLECLGLTSPHITNASMPYLVKLQNLEWLGLEACAIDEQGIAMLAALPKLTSLRISRRAIGNDCLPRIAALRKLQRLELSGESIDDRGLSHLAGMENLKFLDVQSTAVTTDGPAVKQLKQALPNCRIHQYYPNPSFR